MNGMQQLGTLVHSFFVDHLVIVNGLRPSSVRSYGDIIRLLLCFVAAKRGTRITKLTLEDLSFENVLGFLRYLEDERHNHVSPATSVRRPCTYFSTTLPAGNHRCSTRASGLLRYRTNGWRRRRPIS